MKLFIHGVPDTGYMWTPLVKALHLSQDAYIAPTMPGFDGTTPTGFPGTKEAYLEWVIRTLADEIGRIVRGRQAALAQAQAQDLRADPVALRL